MFYREVDFCTENLGMAYSEFMKLPRWERTMYKVYIDVKVNKQEDFSESLKKESSADTGGKP